MLQRKVKCFIEKWNTSKKSKMGFRFIPLPNWCQLGLTNGKGKPWNGCGVRGVGKIVFLEGPRPFGPSRTLSTLGDPFLMKICCPISTLDDHFHPRWPLPNENLLTYHPNPWQVRAKGKTGTCTPASPILACGQRGILFAPAGGIPPLMRYAHDVSPRPRQLHETKWGIFCQDGDRNFMGLCLGESVTRVTRSYQANSVNFGNQFGQILGFIK